MFIPLSTLSLASAISAAYASLQIRSSREQSASLEATDRLYLPILGVTQSGKTLLLASLGEQLTQSSSEQLTTRLLTREEEQRERGKVLKHFDPQDLDASPVPPGERTTAGMIHFERLSFERDEVNEATMVAEDALFALQFATHGPIAGRKLCILEDIPGEHLSEERSHKGNIYPKLLKADGLILVIDGPKALNADREPLPEHLLYQQLLERYLAQDHHGPVWVVITKADLLPEDRQDQQWWYEHTLTHLTPLLQLKDSQAVFELSLVSAKRSCEQPWATLKSSGESFFVSLKSVIQKRLERHGLLSKEIKRARNLCVALMALTLILGWSAAGAWRLGSLPPVSGERAWDGPSLNAAITPRLNALRDAKSILNPLRLFKRSLIHELATLRTETTQLVNVKADRWGKNLSKEREARDLSLEQLSRALKDFQTLNNARAKDRPWSAEERELEELVSMAMNDHGRLSSLESLPDLSTLKRSWTGRCKLALHRQPEREIPPFECALSMSIDRQLVGTRRARLSAATRPTISPADTSQLKARLSPLLQWERENAGLDRSDPLWSRLKTLKRSAWEASWLNLITTIQSMREEEDAIGRLRSLQRFEVERNDLLSVFTSDLEAPTKIIASWRDLLNSECIQAKEDEDLTPSLRREADLIIEWAAPFLDPSRRARVRMKSAEERWLKELKETLPQESPEGFDHALKLMERNLAELKGEEGREVIMSAISEWTQRLKSLQVWRAAQAVKVSASEVECDFDKLEEEGLDHGSGSHFDLDLFVPYLALKLTPIGSIPAPLESEANGSKELILVKETDIDDELSLQWHPWSRLTLALYEQDGEIDVLPETEESDDHLISDHTVWSVGSEPPSTTAALTPKNSCFVTITLHHRLPEWVGTMGLLPKR